MFRNLQKQKNMKNEVLNCKLFLGQDISIIRSKDLRAILNYLKLNT